MTFSLGRQCIFVRQDIFGISLIKINNGTTVHSHTKLSKLHQSAA